MQQQADSDTPCTADLHSHDTPLQQHIQHATEHYLNNLENEEPTQMYELFLHQLEKPLLEAVLKHTRGNQSRTALMLGLNRGTLRSKLKTHGLL